MTWVIGVLLYCTASVVVVLVWCAVCRAGTAAAPTHHDVVATYESASTSATTWAADLAPVTRDELTGT